MTTRQEIYDRIRESSRDEVILEEMIRLGFWPDDRDVPSSTAAEIQRKGQLQRELQALTKENRDLKNADKIRRDQRKKRLAESRKKRQENKDRKLRERAARAQEWKRSKESQILYLGSDHSAGLTNNELDVNRLQKLGLSHISDVAQLASAMNCSVGLLRFLAYGRVSAPVYHYSRFGIKKKTGGIREISAPMPRLKKAQRWILENILEALDVHDASHGFRKNRSIVSNAAPHVGSQVVVNMDLEEFFPTVGFVRVKGVYRKMGFSESVATVLAMICTESPRAEVELDQMTYYVARGERTLPQGAPTSPAITNLICRGLDARLSRIAEEMGFVYTRYADDLTFSSTTRDANVGRLIRRVNFVVSREDFKVHPNKTRVFRTGRRMEVTGLTVNEKLNVSRKELRRFRATLHQIERDGPEGKTWGNSSDVLSAIDGYAKFVLMVSPEKGKKFQEQVTRIFRKHGAPQLEYIRREPWVEPNSTSEYSTEPPQPNTSSGVTQSDEKDSKKWWKFW